MGTMNVYLGGFAKLAASLANERRAAALARRGRLPQRPAPPARRDRRRRRRDARRAARRHQQHRRPRPRDLRLLHRRLRAGARSRRPASSTDGCARSRGSTLAMVLVLAVFSTWFLAVPRSSRLRFPSHCIGTIAEAAGLGPPFAMLKRIEIPVADPGNPDTRSPVRLLVWVGKHQKGTLALGIIFGIWWMLAQALMPFAIGRAIQLGIVEGSNRDLAIWTLVLLSLGLMQAFAGVMRHRYAVFNWLQASFRLAQLVAHHAARTGPAMRGVALDGRGRRHRLERRDARRRRLRHHGTPLGRGRRLRRRRRDPRLVVGGARADRPDRRARPRAAARARSSSRCRRASATSAKRSAS